MNKVPIAPGPSFNVAYTTLLPPTVTVPMNGTIAFTATVTLIADPGSLEVTDVPGGFNLPSFGNFTTSPAPEPASLISFVVGMSAVGLGIGWRHVAGRRGRPERRPIADGLKVD